MFNQDIYIQRRNRLKDQVKSGVILLLGNEESSMNYRDNWYPFRQDSTFLYFFGLDRAGLVGVIDIDANTEILFGDELTPDDVVWMGPQPSIRQQAHRVGVTQVNSLNELDTYLHSAVNRKREIHFLPPYRPENLLKLSNWLSMAPSAMKFRVSVPLIKAVVEQRSIKDPEEITELEKAINVTNEMQLAAARIARAGMTEAEIAGHLHGIAISSGGHLAFPTILTVNGEILHNHYSNKAVLQEGQLVLVDCGASSSMHYSGDLTRTFPVSKTFSAQQQEMYDLVLGSFEHALRLLRPGVLFKEVHLKTCAFLVEGLKELGLMKGDTHDAVEQGAHALFFPCGLGHMLGLDTHDMEDLGEAYVGYTEELKKSTEFGLKSLRLAKALEPGFVLTVEPGLYFNPFLIDMWQANGTSKDFINYEKVNAYRDFGGIRIEEDFLITPEGSRVLGNPLSRNLAEIRKSIL